MRCKRYNRATVRGRVRARTVIGVGVVLVLLAGSAVTAMAQGRRVIRLDAIKVEGRIQKPQAFYILQRSNLNFEALDLKKSFIPKILDSVEQEPF
jgi:hypothetical protein